jgi:hypothetical protein
MDICTGCHQDDAYTNLAECSDCGAAFHHDCVDDSHIISCRARARLEAAITGVVQVGSAFGEAKTCVRKDVAQDIVECLRTVPVNALVRAMVDTRTPGDASRNPIWAQVYDLLMRRDTMSTIYPSVGYDSPDLYLRFGNLGTFPARYYRRSLGGKNWVGAEWRSTAAGLQGILGDLDRVQWVLRNINLGPGIPKRGGGVIKRATAGLIDLPPPADVRLDDNNARLNRLPFQPRDVNHAFRPFIATGPDAAERRFVVYDVTQKPEGVKSWAQIAQVEPALDSKEKIKASSPITNKQSYPAEEGVAPTLVMWWTGATPNGQLPAKAGAGEKRRRQAKKDPLASWCFMQVVATGDIYLVGARWAQEITAEEEARVVVDADYDKRRFRENVTLTDAGARSFAQWQSDDDVVGGTVAHVPTTSRFISDRFGVSPQRMAITSYLIHLDNILTLSNAGIPNAGTHYYEMLNGDDRFEINFNALCGDIDGARIWLPPETLSATGTKLVLDANVSSRFRPVDRFVAPVFMPSLQMLVLETDQSVGCIWVTQEEYVPNQYPNGHPLEVLIIKALKGQLIRSPRLSKRQEGGERLPLFRPRRLEYTNVQIGVLGGIPRMLRSPYLETLGLDNCTYLVSRDNAVPLTVGAVLEAGVLNVQSDAFSELVLKSTAEVPTWEQVLSVATSQLAPPRLVLHRPEGDQPEWPVGTLDPNQIKLDDRIEVAEAQPVQPPRPPKTRRNELIVLDEMEEEAVFEEPSDTAAYELHIERPVPEQEDTFVSVYPGAGRPPHLLCAKVPDPVFERVHQLGLADAEIEKGPPHHIRPV